MKFRFPLSPEGRVLPQTPKTVRSHKDQEHNEEVKKYYDHVCDHLNDIKDRLVHVQQLDQKELSSQLSDQELDKLGFKKNWLTRNRPTGGGVDQHGIKFKNGYRDIWGKDLASEPGRVVLEERNSMGRKTECHFDTENLQIHQDDTARLPQGLVHLKHEKERNPERMDWGAGEVVEYQQNQDGTESYVSRYLSIESDKQRYYEPGSIHHDEPRGWLTTRGNYRNGSIYESKIEIDRDKGYLIYQPYEKVGK